MQWEEVVTSIGYVPYREQHGSPLLSSPTLSSGSKDSKKSVKVVTPIGSLSADSQVNSRYVAQNWPSPERPIWNQPDLPPLKRTAGRKTPELMELSSKSGLSPSIRRAKLTGKWYGKPQDLEESLKFPHVYVYRITGKLYLIVGPSEQLVLISRSLLRTLEPAMSIGVQLGLENRAELGKKPDYLLTVRVQDPSFGTATKVKNTLFSMR